jgi:hypothetical protein
MTDLHSNTSVTTLNVNGLSDQFRLRVPASCDNMDEPGGQYAK